MHHVRDHDPRDQFHDHSVCDGDASDFNFHESSRPRERVRIRDGGDNDFH